MYAGGTSFQIMILHSVVTAGVTQRAYLCCRFLGLQDHGSIS